MATPDTRDPRRRAPRAAAAGRRPAAPEGGHDRRPCARRSSQEFPDISISKIRYLEDQKLLSPRRTQGGYRLYTQTDIQRLRTILRLQRDEFLPLRVIRQELAGGRAEREVAARPGGGRPLDAARARHRRAIRARCTRSRTSSRRPAPTRSWSASWSTSA